LPGYYSPFLLSLAGDVVELVQRLDKRAGVDPVNQVVVETGKGLCSPTRGNSGLAQDVRSVLHQFPLGLVEPGFILQVLAQRSGVLLGKVGGKYDFNGHSSQPHLP